MRGVKRAVTPKVSGTMIWLDFNYKPSFQERKMLKSVGYRWSPSRGMWWCKNTKDAREAASKFNLTEFIAKPKPTEQDFVDWEKLLTKPDWHRLAVKANDIYESAKEKNATIAEQVFMNVLHDEFIKQWA